MGGAYLSLYPGADTEILTYALVVVVVGGLGSLRGAIVGALLVGLVYDFGQSLVPSLAYFVALRADGADPHLAPAGPVREGRMTRRTRTRASAATDWRRASSGSRCARRARARLPYLVELVLRRVATQALFFGLFALSINLLAGYGGMITLGQAGLLGVGGLRRWRS